MADCGHGRASSVYSGDRNMADRGHVRPSSRQLLVTAWLGLDGVAGRA